MPRLIPNSRRKRPRVAESCFLESSSHQAQLRWQRTRTVPPVDGAQLPFHQQLRAGAIARHPVHMDFQAVTCKFGVVECLTKYLTKSGQGSLIGIMEKAFERCMSKAEEESKGAKSAIAKFFNLAATQEVKTQGETMHLLFELPRSLSSRTMFKRVSTRSQARKLKTVDEVDMKDNKILHPPAADLYFNRVSKFKLPCESALLEVHPARVRPLWVDVLTLNRRLEDLMVPSYEGSAPADFWDELTSAWPAYLKHFSWWEFARLFSSRGNVL